MLKHYIQLEITYTTKKSAKNARKSIEGNLRSKKGVEICWGGVVFTDTEEIKNEAPKTKEM